MVDRHNLKLDDALEIRSVFGKVYKVVPVVSKYVSNDSLAVELFSFDYEYNYWEPYCVLTTNIDGASDQCELNCAFIKYAPGEYDDYSEFILDNNIGVFTENFARSGYNVYREVRFRGSFLEKYKDKELCNE